MIDFLKESIKRHKMEDCVTPREIIQYLNADTYENDIYTIQSVLENKYLTLHEILEVCCIKKRGLEITKKVIVENREIVYECHLEAINGELEYAMKIGDYDWIKRRVKDIGSYLNDPYLPPTLQKKVMELIDKWRL